ncbi:MAG: hypothetical protein KDC32_18040, partial [Saprospiraceae bacterium]|nr:hypothetical protein [Saprospiraceae bacterium]
GGVHRANRSMVALFGREKKGRRLQLFPAVMAIDQHPGRAEIQQKGQNDMEYLTEHGSLKLSLSADNAKNGTTERAE